MFLFLIIFSTFILFVKSDCGTVTRKEWDGIFPVSVEYIPSPVDLVIIQHTATPSCTTDQDCAELVRSIQNNHMENLHYWDIGPSFLVGDNGKVYEGPGWIHVGAHTYGYNKRSIAISFLGNFNDKEPSEIAVQAAKDLIKCGVEQGHLDTNYNLVAHRQLIATESPGRKLYNLMRKWPNWQENVISIKKAKTFLARMK